VVVEHAAAAVGCVWDLPAAVAAGAAQLQIAATA
jgi:hypothetical protein